MPLPCGAVFWSVVYDCTISWPNLHVFVLGPCFVMVCDCDIGPDKEILFA